MHLCVCVYVCVYIYICMYMCSKCFYLIGVCNQKHLQTTSAPEKLLSCGASDGPHESHLTKGFHIHYLV